MAYLNKIKILDGENQTSSTTPFNFGIGTLREDDNGNIVYGPEGAKKVFLAADGNGSYTLEDTVLQEYIDNRDTFLKKVEYNNGYINFTFQLSSEDIDDMSNLDTDSREEVISVPVNDFAIDADNIYLAFPDEELYPENIKLTESFGQHKPDSVTGYVEVPLTKQVDGKTKPKSIQELFIDAYQVSKDPVVIPPSASISASGGNGEVGTAFSAPTATLTIDGIGAYTYGPATGVTFKAGDVKLAQGADPSTAKNYKTNDSQMVQDNNISLAATAGGTYGDTAITYTFSGTASYTPNKTAVPVNNLGEKVESLRLGYNATTDSVAIEVKDKTISFTGYRYIFAGGTTANGNNNSDIIRALDKKKRSNELAPTTSGGTGIKFSAAKGSTKVIVAYPATWTSKTPKFEIFTMAWGATGGFEKSTVSVADATKTGGYKDYTVYTYTPAGPLEAENTEYCVYFV